MKKNLFLTLMLAVLCTATSWAQFAPESGTKYALKEVTSGYYLDIQTLGINEPGHTTNSISLSAKPCIIYFEAGSNGKYTMKNANGTYAQQASGDRHWNAVIGTTAYEWAFADSDSDGDYTIARTDGKFIKMDNATNGAPLYCDKDTGLEFALVAYSDIVPGVYTVKTATGTYLTQTEHTATGSKATLQKTAELFKIMPSGNLFYFENNTTAGQYLGTTDSWNATFDFSLLQIVDLDAEGFAAIARAAESNKHIGTNEATDEGRGIFTNVESGWNKWYFEGTYENYPTAGTQKDGKYYFTSDYITYAGACNNIRFTLTESGAFFQNGKNRMSLDEFAIYDADGKKIKLTVANVTGNNNKTYAGLFDGVNGTCGGTATWTDGTEDDWFEILLPVDVDLGGAFKFSFVTENTTMNAKKFTINTSYEKPVDYTVVISAPQGQSVTVTYNGKTIAADDKVSSVGFDKSLFDATDISGYTWSVVVDEEKETVTIQYTTVEANVNPASVVALIKRIGGEAAADKFKFVLDPSMNSKSEVFVIGSDNEKILIKGTTISAITTGIGWYLNNYAHINIAWNSLNEKTVSGAAYADLSNIPVPTGTETRTCDAKYRYYLNYCTFGYSMTTWTWKRWQQEIDWMALHGVNMPLQIVGLEEVWRKFLTLEENGKRKYNYSDEEAKAFVPGPAFTAWWGMNNLEGWGGTAADGWGGVQDDAWYARQKALAKQICDRQRELGMQPVLPGFSGMVPTNFQTKTGVACDAGKWCSFDRPKIVLPSNERFAEIAADYYACLEAVMGVSQYYSIDPFHEGGSISNGSQSQYEDAYKAIYNAMENAKPGSQWVIQQWQWNHNDPNFQAYSINAVPAGRLIVLDLFSDGRPEFDLYSGYAPQEAVFCAVPNFGGRSGLMGRLQNVTDNYFSYKEKYATSIKGIAAAPEAIEQTPVAYDLVFQLPWMGSKPDVKEWVKNYSIARYGVANAELQAVWDLLRQGPLNYGADGIQGPVEDVWAARPNLEAKAASSWGSTLSRGHNIPAPELTYTKERQQMLIEATYKLLAQSSAVSGDINLSNYNYDVVEFGGAVMADYAHNLLLGIKAAKEAAGDAFATDPVYIARRDAFLALIEEVDAFKGTNLNFRLGKWTQEARDAAAEAVALGATSANADWYEYNNARTLITTWGDYAQNNSGGLRDYSYRSWQGLLKDYYLPRWKYYFENDCTYPGGDVCNYFYFEWNWAHGLEHNVGNTSKSSTKLVQGEPGYSYSRDPQGNTVEEANKMLAKYIIPLKTDNGTYYAYRYLTNNIPAEYKVDGAAGGTINFSKFFLADITGATVTGEFVDGAANEITAVPVKSGIAGNTYDAVITLTDGTVLNFKVVVNSAEIVAAKETLAALIEDMKELTAQVATYNPIGTVTDFTDNLTAEGTAGTTEFYVWTNAQEDSEGPIKNLVDGDTETHFHSEYSVNVGANHFINVDLGVNNKMSSFRFSYSTRKAENNFPRTIEVWGCNEREGTYEYITTVSNLPVGNTSSVVTYMSDRITCGKEYAYLRFIVTANNSGYTEAGGHPYFHMSEFGLSKVASTADVIDEYNGTELTDAFAAEKYDVMLNAISVYKNVTAQAEIDAATKALQEAYEDLLAKMPFKGVYHIVYNGKPIFVANDDNPALPSISWYNLAGYKLLDGTLDNTGEGDREIQENLIASKAVADALFTIVPNGDASGYTLSAQGLYMHSTPDQTNGEAWSPLALSTDENLAGVYQFVKSNNEYKLKCCNSDVLNYVNDWGSVFGNNNEADTYATFTFEKVTKYALTVPANGVATFCLPFNVVLPAGLVAYDVTAVGNDANGEKVYQLTQLAASGEKVMAGTPVIVKGGAGEYTLRITIDNTGVKGALEGSLLRGNFVSKTLAVANVDKYTFTADAEFTLLTAQQKIAANSVWMEFDVTIEVAIKEGVVVEPDTPDAPDATVTKPELGKVYRIRNYTANTPDDYKTHYLVNSNVSIAFPVTVAKDDKSAMWVCTGADEVNGKYKFASALGTAAFGWQGVAEEALEYTISDGTIAGTVTLANGTTSLALTTEAWNNSGNVAFNQASNGTKTQSEHWSTDWYLEEVVNPEVSFTRAINKDNQWATMYLPYAVEIPTGVEVYYAAADGAIVDKTISLTQLDGTIPARTAVLLHRNANAKTDATVEYTFNLAADVAPLESNLFDGKILQTAIDATNARVYLLINYNKEAFYWMAAEYNANCQLSENGGYVKCDANKCYLRIENAKSSSFSFRFPGSTDVEDVKTENGEVKTIYDLQGRKLTEIIKPGIYIVDGEKVWIK